MTIANHTGSCHCGAVRFTVALDASRGTRCNCTICTKLGILGSVVPPDAFTLVAGEPASYVFRTPMAQRYFCQTCGTHCFGRGDIPELGGAFVSINLNCLDDLDPYQLPVVHWDGRHDNWDAGTRETPWPIFRKAS